MWTDLGMIPDDWAVVPLWDLAKFGSGESISVARLSDESSESPVPVFGGNGVAGYTDRALVSQPTVVLGRVGQKCGAVYLSRGPAWITDNALFPTYLATSVHVPFLALALENADLNSVRNRNDLPLLTQGILRSVQVAWPPSRAEQCVIAEALSDVDGLLGALDALIAKKRAIKQAAMWQLLTGKTRLPGFSGEWVTKRLGEIGHFLKGSGVKRDDSRSGPLACVRYGEIYTTHHDYVRNFHSWISPEVAALATCLEYGDLLFAGSGETKEEIGKCVAFVTETEAYAGGDIVILRPSNVDPLFSGYALNMPDVARQKASLGQGDAVVHISAGSLAQVRLHVPSVEEQAAIATVLADMDAEIAALEVRRDKTRAIKQGMMQQLLTGRVRLVKPEAGA